jgi:hypothetical protein
MAPALIDTYPSAAPCYISHVASLVVLESCSRLLSTCGLRMVGGTGSAEGDRWEAVQLARIQAQSRWCGW